MKVKIEIEFDDVNYEEIEEIADLFEFELEDELEDEVDLDELLYLDEEEELFEWIELYDTMDPK